MGRRSARVDEGCFVVEGPSLVAEAVAAGWDVEGQYVAPGVRPVDAPGVAVHELAVGVIERVATTEAPQGMLAVVRMRTTPVSALTRATFLVAVDGVGDPGNVGTILRSAEAAGADGVVLTAGSVDVFNPKVVRASAGALFHVPFVAGVSLADLVAPGRRLIGTSSHRGVSHTEADLRAPVVLVLGNEAHGLADDAAVDDWVRVAHHGRSESLNVAMAATVLCFEVARQRAVGNRHDTEPGDR